ncbi:disulfide bond formation protein [Campylobacter sputorum subsp. bubulus]|uniref:Disulfide bond formation protein n=1 Tax=Campylobacter sputorum subsp. sputorum TaxID=32024 RepID=A0A381DH35_9BACT|nr:disulfide bond formation protein B [Campylobacter sputorum]ASM35068.1 disulfide bond formation protein, DsbB family [Campylobacter sputorum aubsp. sputorum RM3237]KAB0581329.1 disulfide bond formation protein B [Campylobacter sputorum subsp. sputorum]QEL05258.1 disulfide bond formation protein, DsbB family [Campylobacter sputorum subsp. sputorum]SUX08942.1 disulfide bond formation protein [Campylobacter sputorum subsp. bubulus]SUX09755.1 disulfide bond formation protein [Campylobacter sputo
MFDYEKKFFNQMSVAVILLMALPVGIACIILGFGMGDSPCIMCWAERITMIVIAFIGLLIVRYGFKVSYFAALIFMACWGLFNGFIHYTVDGTFGGYLDIKQGFGLEILGAHTQFWVIVVNFCVLLFLGLIFILNSKHIAEIMKKSADNEYEKELKNLFLGKVANIVFIVIIAFNSIQAFVTSGVPPYLASSTPARMSLDSDKWFWEKDHWESTFDFRFDWNPELPDLPE